VVPNLSFSVVSTLSLSVVPNLSLSVVPNLPFSVVPTLSFSCSSYPVTYLFFPSHAARTFVYSMLMRGRPFPLHVMLEAGVFCSLNGFAQSHYLVHCAHYHPTWTSDTLFILPGSTLFLLGMAINVHSDYLLRNLRQPGEVVYKIPKGGLFHYVSGANYFGEIVEWMGYAIATWSLTTFSFAFCSLCFIGRRAFHHHRYMRHISSRKTSKWITP
uniref:3-oxo-5-alpha-steroid 4-dehydrogenase C-terminal domain-containing protein n=1 Tax=Hucho hucho TaxID=62062 RepID=A0A4W5MAM3_9TELE